MTDDLPTSPPGEPIRSGSLEIRLSRSADEVDAAQALRYRVFYDEMAARPDAEMLRRGRDFDAYDAVCDHLVVLDHALGEGPEAIVATYRLIRSHAAAKAGAFYTTAEYDIAPLLAFDGNLLELGRSCVDARYRTRGTMQLLWQGIAAYVFEHEIGLMFGCASLPGTDPDALAVPLSYLKHHHLAPPALRPRALAERLVDMDLLPPDGYDPKRAMVALPPLIKGYLRLGGWVGDGAVVDHQFNTTDVCVVVKTDAVTEKYRNHYARSGRMSPVPGEA